VLFHAQTRMPDGSMSECQHCIPLHIGGEVKGEVSEVNGVDGILQVALLAAPSSSPLS
jgi:hypothetical protein